MLLLGQGYVDIFWDDLAEYSKDVVTGYSDFEGYKIYKSKDGGSTWGDAEDMIYDVDGVFAGWRPYQQFDLSRKKILFIVFILIIMIAQRIKTWPCY